MNRHLGKRCDGLPLTYCGIVTTNTGYGTSANKVMPEAEQQRDL